MGTTVSDECKAKKIINKRLSLAGWRRFLRIPAPTALGHSPCGMHKCRQRLDAVSGLPDECATLT